ncbi:GntR family transcriptional regulator [bacterium]|nr:GntR family transcriptional regulator [bacterium]
MAIDHTKQIPLYKQIIEDIKRQIGAGYLNPGDQLPSNAELTKTYDVSLITVKNAIADLIRDGYVYGRVGRGTFVADPGQFATPPTAGNLGFVLTNFSNPFFTGILHHIESRVVDFGYRLLVSYSSDNVKKEDDQIRHFQDLEVKGLIIASTEHTNQVSDSIFELHKSSFPYVMVSYVEDPLIHYVGTDHEQGAFLATEFLIRYGCRQPGFLNAERGNPLGKLRRKGFIKALKSYSIDYQSPFEFHFEAPGQDFQSGYQVGKEFLKRHERPDGIFAFNDHSALGFERALTEAGLKIPEDVALIGFDDVEFDVPPPVTLTTIRQPADEIALQTMLMLNHQIENHEYVHRKILKPKLIIRDSCGVQTIS